MKFIKRLGAVALAAAVAWCILPSPAASAAANPNGSAVARQIMDEGMVLLKNQLLRVRHLLWLQKSYKIYRL